MWLDILPLTNLIAIAQAICWYGFVLVDLISC